MSHLEPTQSVTITGGGSAIAGSRQGGSDPDPLPADDWDTRVAGFAEDLETDPVLFATRLDETVEAFALLVGLELDVARTRVVGALNGVHGMVTNGTDVDIDDDVVLELLLAWDIDAPDDSDLVLARLAVLHTQLTDSDGGEVEASPTEAGVDDPAEPIGDAGETPAPGDPTEAPGTLEYTLDSVPEKASDVVDWIRDADDHDATQARARAALDVEQARDQQRSTVIAAAEAALGDGR